MIPTNEVLIKKEITLDELFVLNKIREAGEFATIRIEKQKGKLVFVSCENKERIVAKNKGIDLKK